MPKRKTNTRKKTSKRHVKILGGSLPVVGQIYEVDFGNRNDHKIAYLGNVPNSSTLLLFLRVHSKTFIDHIDISRYLEHEDAYVPIEGETLSMEAVQSQYVRYNTVPGPVVGQIYNVHGLRDTNDNELAYLGNVDGTSLLLFLRVHSNTFVSHILLRSYLERESNFVPIDGQRLSMEDVQSQYVRYHTESRLENEQRLREQRVRNNRYLHPAPAAAARTSPSSNEDRLNKRQMMQDRFKKLLPECDICLQPIISADVFFAHIVDDNVSHNFHENCIGHHCYVKKNCTCPTCRQKLEYIPTYVPH